MVDGSDTTSCWSMCRQVVQRDEVQEGCQHLVLESNSCLADAVTATEDQLTQVFDAILVAPKHVDGAGDARVMGA